MRRLNHLTALAMLLLGACAEGTAPPATAQAPAAPAAAAIAAGPAGTAFDGRWSGPNSLLVSRGSACGPQSYDYVMMVRNGQANLTYDRTRGYTVAGPVMADGSFTLQPTSAASDMVFTGKVEGEVMTGEARGRVCARSFTLRRGGPG